MSGAPGGSAGYASGSHNGSRAAHPPVRSFEERTAAKEQMMQSVRDSSQQDRRVYVGNLAYDVKWHHLKDFMRQGMIDPLCLVANSNLLPFSWGSSLRRCITTSEWNVEGGHHCLDMDGLCVFLLDMLD